MAAYLRQFALAFVSFLLLVAAVDVLVDPYRLWSGAAALDASAPRPRAVQHDALLKLRGIARTAPATLVLGNSRAEIGFDPAARSWPHDARPVYNAAIPGTGIDVARDMLAAAIAAGNVRRAIVGLDFLDFLVDRKDAVQDVAAPNPGRFAPKGGDLSIIGSMDTFFDAFATLLAIRDPDSADIDAYGFNPLHEYRRYARQEGYASLFLQKDRTNARSYMKQPKSVFAGDSKTSSAWEQLEALRREAQRAGVEVRFVIYPYHARMLEMFRRAGLMPAFMSWKRQLVHRIDGTPGSCPLWDFSGYDDVTMDAVPPPGDKTSVTRWYWESGHFKAEVGDKMLGRMFGSDPSDFGACLTQGNVALRNGRLEVGHAAFETRFPLAASEIERLFASASP